jgi:CheY-like chemotaxis protein
VAVLLCEDSPDNQILFRRYLEIYGAKVDIADDGAEGLRLLAKKDYDVILMDIEMPGLDGYETTRLLRAKNYSQPVIGLSGHALDLERQRALASGFTAYLVKPISASKLVEEIQRVLSRSEPLTKDSEGQNSSTDGSQPS